MKVYSLMKQGVDWHPLEVEVQITKSMPDVKFLGLPDAVAKESIERIKAAFHAYELPWPKTKRLVINLRPNNVRKKSNGIDLAIAIGILKEMKFFESDEISTKDIFYGEVDLSGQIHQPEDLQSFIPTKKDVRVVTGKKEEAPLFCRSLRLSNFGELGDPQAYPSENATDLLEPPELPSIRFTEQVATLISVLAVGGHSSLLAGPSGTGKTTMAHSLLPFLSPPTEEEFRWIRRVNTYFGEEPTWRPLVAPHHTTPTISMVGGAVPITPGELTRAHNGLLLLDEFLEFGPSVVEALREPMESGVLKVARRGVAKSLPANFQLIATTNLCPCGKYVPNMSGSCRYSIRKCRSYLERLSGPILDRFDVLAFSKNWAGVRSVSSLEIFERINKAREFKVNQNSKLNSRLEMDELILQLSNSAKNIGYPGESASFRRHRAVLRVARTLADLDQSKAIELNHLTSARTLALEPFDQIEGME